MPAAFTTLLDSATHAIYRDEQLHVFTDSVFHDTTEQVLTSVQLDTLHPELRPTLTRVSEYYRRCGLGVDLAAEDVQNIWVHYTHPRCLLNEFNEKQHIGHVKALVVDDPNQQVMLRFYAYQLLTELPAGLGLLSQAVPAFPSSAGIRFAHASFSWMDTNYPGWKERYVTGDGLGYDVRTIANFVCNYADVVPLSTPLTGVSFD